MKKGAFYWLPNLRSSFEFPKIWQYTIARKKEHVHHDAINGFWVGVCDGKIPQVPRSFLLEPLKRCISRNDINRKQIGRWKGLCLEDIGIDAVPNTSMQIYIYILYICLYIDTVYFKITYMYIYIYMSYIRYMLVCPPSQDAIITTRIRVEDPFKASFPTVIGSGRIQICTYNPYNILGIYYIPICMYKITYMFVQNTAAGSIILCQFKEGIFQMDWSQQIVFGHPDMSIYCLASQSRRVTEVFSTIRCVALRLQFWGAKHWGDEGN